MSGQEADPATLFRLYVEYGRYAEATNLFVEYINATTSLVRQSTHLSPRSTLFYANLMMVKNYLI